MRDLRKNPSPTQVVTPNGVVQFTKNQYREYVWDLEHGVNPRPEDYGTRMRFNPEDLAYLPEEE